LQYETKVFVLLQTYITDIINCNAFSEMPSITNENVEICSSIPKNSAQERKGVGSMSGSPDFPGYPPLLSSSGSSLSPWPAFGLKKRPLTGMVKAVGAGRTNFSAKSRLAFSSWTWLYD